MKRRCLAGMLIAASARAAPATAAVLTCSFTEPFITVTYDAATGKVVLVSPNETDDETGEPVPRTLADHARLRRADQWEGAPKLLLEAKGELILEVRLMQGSDGMSDWVYPLEGVYGRNVGGCETDKVRAFDMYQLNRDLGLEP